MRKIIFSILLASAAASPALAQDHGRWHNDEAKGDRAQAREERQQAHEQRGNGGGEPARVQQQVQAPRVEQRQGGGFEGRRFDGGNFAARQRVVDQQQQQQVVPQQQQEQRRYSGGWRGSAGQGGQVQQNQATGGWSRDRSNWSHDRDGDYRQRQTDQQTRDSSRWANGNNWNRSGSRWSGNWNRDWRNDRRYDWRNYRNNHRSVFHLGIYYDPFGYGYQSFDIGYRLQPFYYQQQYWIDPGMYQLPYPPPGTMWVRYFDDALLVDMYSGQVVDVIRGFFW